MSQNKMNTPIDLQGAVLMIGSLFWETEDNAIDESVGRMRREWRETNFNISESISINVPIRYGRVSSTRGNTYTMIFSNGTPAIGTALLAPFKEKISTESEYRNLEMQAFELAKAEQICKDGEFNLFKDWGTIALYLNPSFEKREPEIAAELRDWWGNKFKGFLKKDKFRLNGLEDLSVSEDGFINFPIVLTDETIDYFFCTPIAPNTTDYPSVSEIVSRIIESGYATYFKNNISNKILTFQDEEIAMQLSSKIVDEIPTISSHTLCVNYYAKTEIGLSQYRYDLKRKLGDGLFASSKELLCFYILQLTKDDHGLSITNEKDSINIGCEKMISVFQGHFGDRSISLFEEKINLQDNFLFHLLELDHAPGFKKTEIEKLVTSDLKKMTDQVDWYESMPFIKEFKEKNINPRNQNENTIYDFYNRCLTEQKKILEYFLNRMNERVIAKCKTRYLKHTDYYEGYYDRPYLSSIPNFDKLFNHELIDKVRHRLGNIPIQKGRELSKLYEKDKRGFYIELQKYHNFTDILHDINYNISQVPENKHSRKELFIEMSEFFQQGKWYGFYSLAITQIEGLFSEMANSIAPGKRFASLTDKVSAVRPFYNYSDQYFDYYQYHIPNLRNKFAHFGIDEELELKSYDLLYDLHHLLNVYVSLQTPLQELTNRINHPEPEHFFTIADFTYFFSLLNKIKNAGQLPAIIQKLNEYESGHIKHQVDFDYLSMECSIDIKRSFEHYYETLRLYSKLNKELIDLFSLTEHQINTKKEDFAITLKPFYKSYTDIFDNLLAYESFFTGHEIWLPSMDAEPRKRFTDLYSQYKSDFKKLGLVLKIIDIPRN